MNTAQTRVFTLMIFIEPQSAYESRNAYGPQATGPTLRRVNSIRGHKMWEHMRQYGGAPVGLWKVIGALVKAEHPCDREDARTRAVYYLVGFRELRRAGLMYRHFGLISTQDFAYAPSQKWRKTLLPAARASASQKAVSNIPSPSEISVRQQDYPPQVQGAKPMLACQPAPTKTESARPSAENGNAAARLLAMEPRPRQRKWTGEFNGQRVRRRTMFKLPNGDILPAVLILRGKVYVFREDSDQFIERYSCSEVRPVKNPAAVLLGRLKRGKREAPSERKATTARINGAMPCRPGKRRGRPRKPIAAR